MSESNKKQITSEKSNGTEKRDKLNGLLKGIVEAGSFMVAVGTAILKITKKD